MTRLTAPPTFAVSIVTLGVALGLGACEIPEVTATSTDTGLGVGVRPDTASGPYRVARVADGDTIVVDEGQELTTVRLIGIDTPETKHPDEPVQCYGPEASAHVEALLEGTLVWLEGDPTQGDTDRYGRRLAYVWSDEHTMVNETLLAEGYAREYTYDAAYSHQERFRQAQDDAQSAGAGLWSPQTCDGRSEA